LPITREIAEYHRDASKGDCVQSEKTYFREQVYCNGENHLENELHHSKSKRIHYCHILTHCKYQSDNNIR
jgi:hypothetical protein